MITRIAVRGIKSLRDVTIHLAPDLTVIVGANNSGKSNALTVLRLLKAATEGQVDNVAAELGGWNSLLSQPGDGAWRIAVTACDQQSGRVVTYEIGRTPLPNGSVAENECIHVGDEQVRGPTLIERGPNGRMEIDGSSSSVEFGRMFDFYIRNAKQPDPAAVDLSRRLKGIIVADLSVNALRAPSQIVRNAQLDPTGANLAAVLDWLAVSNPTARARVDSEVMEAAKEVTRVLTAPSVKPGHKVVAIEESGQYAYTAEQMSDGLVLFVGLSAMIQLVAGTQSLIAIEEPERGIHPRRLREIVEQLRRVAGKGVQVVMTTHSPILLDELREQPGSVLVFDRDDEGTHVTRLSDKPGWMEALSGQPLGDLWYSGVLGGVPSR